MGFFSGSAGGLIGGLFSGIGQAAASKRMLQATRETNEQNYKIWQEQKAHNVDMFNMQNQASIDMWNMQNEYNDPTAQMQRASNAGLNPYMAVGNGAATGNATNAPAVGTATPAQAIPMQQAPVEAFDNGISTAVGRGLEAFGTIMQGINTDADTKNKGAEFGLIGAQTDESFSRKFLNNTQRSYLEAMTKGQQWQNFFNYRTEKLQIQQMEEGVRMQKLQNVALGLGNQEKTVLNSYLGAERTLQLGSIYYGMVESFYRGQISRKEFEHWNQNFNAMIRKIGSETAKNYASANLMDTQQQREDQHMQKERLDYMAFANAFQSYEKMIDMTFQADLSDAELRKNDSSWWNREYSRRGIFGFNGYATGLIRGAGSFVPFARFGISGK